MVEWIISEVLKVNPWMNGDEETAWNYIQAMNNSELLNWMDKYLERNNKA